MFGVAVLASAAYVGTATVGCGGDGRRSKASDEAKEEREAAARDDLRKARNAGTEEAFRLVMKRHPETSAAEDARGDIAKLREAAARGALAKGDRKAARALAEEALKLGDPMVAEQARTTLEQVDRSDARNTGKSVKELLAAGENTETCGKAVALVAEVLGAQPSPLLSRDMRKETLQPLSSCLQAVIDGSDKMETFAASRKLIDSPAAKSALGPDTFHAVSSAFNDKAVQTLFASVQPDLKANKWEGAFATIKSWADAGATGPQQLEVASQQVRDHITKELLVKGGSSLGQARPEPVLADIDRALKLFEGLNVAPELKSMRTYLATWIECKKLACTAIPRTRMAYSFGATGLMPLTEPAAAAPTDTLPNATKLWALATGKGKALVAREDPGDIRTWSERMAAARGWVDASVLHNEDTTLWLPVGKALEGVRVWLPTGRDDKLYLLGHVESVDGTDVTVKKISDGQTSTVKRDVLRTGVMPKGLKVMAFCQEQLQQTEARYEESVTITAGTSVARVMCFTPEGKDEKTKDVVFGSLRAKPEWLPARRP
jgi:hypothetical protein